MALLFKNIKFGLNLKTFFRHRRIQSRKPLAAYEDFNEAYDSKVTLKQQKEINRKTPQVAPIKQNKESFKIPRVQFNIKGSSKTEQVSEQEKDAYTTLQNEADRIYYKHDPYLKGENLTDDVIQDIEQNVDFLAVKLSKKDDILST